uniref:Uncharacterized protein n=1 Tax=Helianthus annuus TaxID=4232 RepID=A0A251S144_HELAN
MHPNPRTNPNSKSFIIYCWNTYAYVRITRVVESLGIKLSIIYIKTIQTYATWHSLKPLIATCIPLNSRVLCLGAKTKACKP